MSTDLQTSKRFQPPTQRRDFLGLAALWSAGIALMIGLMGALRLPVPAVFPESNSRVKLGSPHKFKGAEVTWFPEYRLWIFSDAGELYAISAICTHLGCTVGAQEGGGFFCPCHGSRFDPTGAVVAGPAPRRLVNLELFVSPDGQLVVDQQKEVSPQTRLKV
jgi:cytochrome b6-f complex iron-sulfur subunit